MYGRVVEEEEEEEKIKRKKRVLTFKQGAVLFRMCQGLKAVSYTYVVEIRARI